MLETNRNNIWQKNQTPLIRPIRHLLPKGEGVLALRGANEESPKLAMCLHLEINYVQNNETPGLKKNSFSLWEKVPDRADEG